jgi:RNA polymerase sigma factor (sigma-70 family)
MDFDDVWAGTTEKLGDTEKKERSLHFQQGTQFASSSSLPSLKKIRLLPLIGEEPTVPLSAFENIPAPPAVPIIKPPPLLFKNLWGENESVSAEDTHHASQTGKLHLEPDRDGQEDMLAFETASLLTEEQPAATQPLEQEESLDIFWENPSEKIEESWLEDASASFEDTTLFDDLDLFDVDAALAQQEEKIQQQEYEQEKAATERKSRFERWGGFSSLIYVNWENPETAEQDALARLGYASILLNQETRAFIIQAARNSRLPHRQEILLTTQLASARAQLTSLPPHNEEDVVDPFLERRQALHAEITEIEQALIVKMQWVGIKKAVQFLGQGLELDDLIQFGLLGVMAGVKHFDITRKARLIRAVSTWVFQSLLRAVIDYGSAIRLPAYLFEQAYQLQKYHQQWQQQHGRLPSRRNIAELMDIPVQNLDSIISAAEVLRQAKRASSIEDILADEYRHEGYSFQEAPGNVLAQDDSFSDLLGEMDGQNLQQALFQELTPRQTQVFALRAGLNEDGVEHTLEEIGQQLGVTRERIRQIEDHARKKMALKLQAIYPAAPVPQEAHQNEQDTTGEGITQPHIQKKPLKAHASRQKQQEQAKRKLAGRRTRLSQDLKIKRGEALRKADEQADAEQQWKAKEQLKEVERLLHYQYSHKPKW